MTKQLENANKIAFARRVSNTTAEQTKKPKSDLKEECDSFKMI